VMGRRRRIDAFVERESLLLTALPSLVHEKGYEPIGRMRGYRRSDRPDRTSISSTLRGTPQWQTHRNYTAARTVELQGGFSAMSRSPDRRHGLAGRGVPLPHQAGGQFR
jgi:hypothetical protein